MVHQRRLQCRFKRRMAIAVTTGPFYWEASDGPRKLVEDVSLPSELATFVQLEQAKVDGVSEGLTDSTWGMWRHFAGYVTRHTKKLHDGRPL